MHKTTYSITIFVETKTENAILIQQKYMDLIEKFDPDAIVTAGMREELEDEQDNRIS